MSRVLGLAGAGAALAGAAFAALLAFVLTGEPGPGPFAHKAFSFRCAQAEDGCAPQGLIPLARGAPLDARGFEAAMQAAFEAGETDAARRLAAQVLKRNTRSNLARFILANEAAEAGDPDRFLSLYLPQFRIDPRGESVSLFASVLAAYSRDPQYFTRLERHVLEARPSWGAAYLRALLSDGALPRAGLSRMFAEYPAAQPALLREMMEEGEAEEAYGLFAGWLSEGALAREPPVLELSRPFNPGLSQSPAPSPFNWHVTSRAAEYVSGGGVYVFFEGRKAETFLSQIFPLEAGDWRLRLRVSGQASETGGSFRWRLACADGSGMIASHDLKSLGAAPSDSLFDLSLSPEACPFVRLSLEGVPGMFPQPSRLEVHTVSLERREPDEEGG
jgi:hypothetical protein